MSSLAILLFVIAPFLLVEAVRSRINEHWLRRRGAVEPAGDPYGAIATIYTGGFVAMAIEGWWRGGTGRPWLLAGLLVFALAKLLKFYAVRSLGPRWSFRILVQPGEPLVSAGPYRYLRHPNYVAIYLEFAGAALMLNAPVMGPIVALAFLIFLRKRVAVEERALGIRT
jgi:methyltransferase